MKALIAAALAAAVALLSLGLLAGTVIGSDGAVGVTDRLAGELPEPTEQTATLRGDARAGAAAKKKRSNKPRVTHGFGQSVDVASGATSAISLSCPRRTVPVSAGLDGTPGIFASAIFRAPNTRRAMFVGVVNTTAEPGSWTATIACMKGVKEG